MGIRWSFLLVLLVACGAAAQEPWIITTPVTIAEPQELGEIIVFGDGELRVENVPEPGVRFAGNVLAVWGGRIVLRDSVIRFESTYHGQYSLVAFAGGEVDVSGWDRVLGANWDVAPELIPSACGPRRGGPRPTVSR